MNNERLALSVEEAARRISVCSKTVHNLIRRGQLQARKIGSRTVILVSDLEKFLESRQKVSAVERCRRRDRKAEPELNVTPETSGRDFRTPTDEGDAE